MHIKDGFWSARNTSLANNCKGCNMECNTCNHYSSCIEWATEWTLFINDQGCCLEICREYSNETACSAYLTSHAFVDDEGLCSCKAGYYGNRPLNCKDYYQSVEMIVLFVIKCLHSLHLSNAYPTLDDCICKDGFGQLEIQAWLIIASLVIMNVKLVVMIEAA